MSKVERLVESVNTLPVSVFWEKYFPQAQLCNLEAEICSSHDRNVRLQVSSAGELKTEHRVFRDQCFKLIEANAAHDYQTSEIKWSPASKRREMVLPDMRYLLVLEDLAITDTLDAVTSHHHIPSVLGFLSFMVTYEDRHEVVYIYEIHLRADLRGRGIGSTLMGAVEAIARLVEVEKVMLTVFKANTKAVEWYHKIGYSEDEFSPQPLALRNGRIKQPTYMILSKALDRKVDKQ